MAEANLFERPFELSAQTTFDHCHQDGIHNTGAEPRKLAPDGAFAKKVVAYRWLMVGEATDVAV